MEQGAAGPAGGAMIAVSIPAVGPGAEPVRSPEKTRTVFTVEVLFNGRKHTLEKRYSEFHALHKRIRKICKVPDFPPKRVPNWMSKVLEQRRQGLEFYIQGVLYYNKELPKELLDFLKLRHFHQDVKAGSLRHGVLLPHRPALSFHKDPYVFPSSTELLPDVVLSGVLQGLYAPAHPCWGKAAPHALSLPCSAAYPPPSLCSGFASAAPAGRALLSCPI
ncbi:sorting nexin-22 [Pelodiscus sinensis]|uniref:sorting nexin-22 n=1 Tax=Pelodiscus sinensis TaxID=13735 RepID=UPI003F6A84EE